MLSVKGKVVKHYKDLIVWQKAHEAALKILALYKKARKTSATYEIWKQCLRAAFSVPANIVEGYYGHRGKNFISRLEISRGEAGETDYWMFVLFEINEVTKEEYEELRSMYNEVIAMLTAIISKH